METYASYVGTKLTELPVPALIVDKSVVKRNCEQMLSICDALGVKFRAHIKTHKTESLTAMMTGLNTPAKQRPEMSLIVSTLPEAFHVLPLLKTAQIAGKHVNLLYGVPLAPSKIPDLDKLMAHLGPDSVTVMIDNPDQLESIRVAAQKASTNFRPCIFVKIDTGYGRAGAPSDTQSTTLRTICEKTSKMQKEGLVKMLGFYSHAGDSYSVDDAASAFDILAREIKGLAKILPAVEAAGLKPGVEKGFVLSVGATPTTRSAWLASAGLEAYKNSEFAKLIREVEGSGDIVEFHAGNYPFLDMQQLATNSGLSSIVSPLEEESSSMPPTGLEDIGLSVLAEVNSFYNERDASEYLITAGSLALGREPCKSYQGWGVVSDWPWPGGMCRGSGWIVSSISQEHGKLGLGEVPGVKTTAVHRSFALGEKVRIWPNHACIASANFPVFFVVDGSDNTGGNVVREVWARCRGWW